MKSNKIKFSEDEDSSGDEEHKQLTFRNKKVTTVNTRSMINNIAVIGHETSTDRNVVRYLLKVTGSTKNLANIELMKRNGLIEDTIIQYIVKKRYSELR